MSILTVSSVINNTNYDDQGLRSINTLTTNQEESSCHNTTAPSVNLLPSIISRPAIIHRCVNHPHYNFSLLMDQIRVCGWYWGSLSPSESEKILSDKPTGSFIVRDSTDERHIFTLSAKTDSGCVHVRILQHKGQYSFGQTPSAELNKCAATLIDLINETVKDSSGVKVRYILHPIIGANGVPERPAQHIKLCYPVSRFCVVYSLKHLSRFEILRSVRRDHIEELPVPSALKHYLKDPRNIVEYR